MGQPSDEELIKAAQQGDHTAWQVLVERFQDGLFRAIRRLCRCDGDAEDYVQSTFLVAYEKLDTLESPAAIGSWLYRIARNKVRARHRRERGRSFGDGEEADIESESEDPLSAALRRERIQDVRNCIDNLPPEQRSALELKMDQAMTLQEISDAEHIPFGTAQGRIRLGLEKLRDCLESKGYGYER
ncbi:MAG: sigma-70 family RNA polymerase sigma factor [Planctomycetota bacterium]|nr:sigma-70 family RNA polymerase sigma factor [Planctomycetota bacterium]